MCLGAALLVLFLVWWPLWCLWMDLKCTCYMIFLFRCCTSWIPRRWVCSSDRTPFTAAPNQPPSGHGGWSDVSSVELWAWGWRARWWWREGKSTLVSPWWREWTVVISVHPICGCALCTYKCAPVVIETCTRASRMISLWNEMKWNSENCNVPKLAQW